MIEQFNLFDYAIEEKQKEKNLKPLSWYESQSYDWRGLKLQAKMCCDSAMRLYRSQGEYNGKRWSVGCDAVFKKGADPEFPNEELALPKCWSCKWLITSPVHGQVFPNDKDLFKTCKEALDLVGEKYK